MKNRLTERLRSLKTELEKGHQRMKALDMERNELSQAMLRISGAIQVLEEELHESNDSEESLSNMELA